MREAGGRHCVFLGGFFLFVLGVAGLISSYVSANVMNSALDDSCAQIQSFVAGRVIPGRAVCPNCASPVTDSISTSISRGIPCTMLVSAFDRRRCMMDCAKKYSCTIPSSTDSCKAMVGAALAPFGDGMTSRVDNPSYSNDNLRMDVYAGAYATGTLSFIFITCIAGIPGILAPVFETAAQPFSARFCNIWYSIVSGLLVGPVAVIAVLYFVLYVYLLESNSVGPWLSENSVDLGKCDTFFFTRELVTWDEAMGTGLLPFYPNGGVNGGGQDIYTCSYYTGVSRAAIPFLCTALLFALASIVLFFASCACCYYKPVKGKKNMTTNLYPEPATTFGKPTAIYTTTMDTDAVVPRHQAEANGWKDPWNPLPVPGANERHFWHGRSLVPQTRSTVPEEPYIGSWSGSRT